MAGPLDELVARITRMVRAFSDEHGLTEAEVRMELADGREFVVASVSPEPGFGFFSIVPHVEPGDEPTRVVVPIGIVKLIELSAPDPVRPFGFVPAD
jgi:hypothetical protein